MSVELTPLKQSTLMNWRFIQLLLASVISVVVIRVVFNTDRSYEDFDLGTETQAVLATRNGKPCHFTRLDREPFLRVLEDIDQSKLPLVLFLGNSQSTSIHLSHEGSKNYIDLLSKPLSNRAFLLGHTLPNCNLQEQQAILTFWTQKENPRIVILPLFYDDLREDGLRDIFLQFLAEEIECADRNKRLCRQLQTIRDKQAVKNSTDSAPEVATKPPSLQERCEAFLNGILDKQLIVWKNRANVRGEMFVFLYRLRNTVFNITAQSKRKVIAANEKTNLEALDDILAISADRDIRVLAYIPPLRQDVDPPYDMDAYRTFKVKMEEKFTREKLRLINLDGIVPSNFWGMKDSTNLTGTPEYDFMHFQEDGHRRLAEALLPTLTEMIDQL